MQHAAKPRQTCRNVQESPGLIKAIVAVHSCPVGSVFWRIDLNLNLKVQSMADYAWEGKHV